MVLLIFLAWLFVSGSYAVVVKVFTPRRAHVVANNLLASLIPCSVIIYIEMQWGISLWSTNSRNLRGCYIWRWDNSSQLEGFVGKEKYVLTTLSCFGKWSHDIRCDKVARCRCWDKLQFTPVAILWVDSWAAWEGARNVVSVGGHVLPITVLM